MSTNGNATASHAQVLPLRHSQLSAAQRSKLTDDMVALLQAHSRQLQRLTLRVEHQASEIAALKQQQGVTFNSLAEFCGRALRGRVRWILTGR